MFNGGGGGGGGGALIMSCINFAETEETMVHYILQPRHIFIRVKAFVFMFVPGGLQSPIIGTCFAWCLVTSISKSHVSRARVNCNIKAWLYLH